MKPLSHQIAERVKARRLATADELMVDFPHLTRAQVLKALSCAKLARQIRIVRPGVGGFRPVQAIYGAPEQKDEPMPISCVWELGDRAAMGHTKMLPKFEGGRSYSPLGSWRD